MEQSHVHNLWESETLNDEQQREIEKVLSVKGGRELLIWYQERLKHGYYLDMHNLNPEKEDKVLESLENSQESKHRNVKPFPSTMLMYCMEAWYNYVIAEDIALENPDNEVGCIYLTNGITEPDKACLYAKCGNALVGYKNKYLALSTSSRNETLYGSHLSALYKEGVYRIYGDDMNIGSKEKYPLHQTVTMLPTKVFMNMQF